ncbi:hypothetical protein B0T14DRAFT_596937 [Immersiella caudata]|uniref:Amidase domain-containing protein n=1 Tax=Immersiella caudata TaxID=314043 RepID=A0AA39XC57_9PEZI|nr:hypothetical protein B0T14DRAFT_596937 [Immersiella caudata]
MPVPNELRSLTASEVRRLINNEELNAEDYTKELLERIKSRDSIEKAWKYLDPDLVLNQASALNKVPRHQRSRLHSLAIAVKDIIDTKDIPTEYSSVLYNGNQPVQMRLSSTSLGGPGLLLWACYVPQLPFEPCRDRLISQQCSRRQARQRPRNLPLSTQALAPPTRTTPIAHRAGFQRDPR